MTVETAGGRLAVIGAGALGLSMVRGLVEARVYTPDRIVVADPDPARREAAAQLPGLVATADNREAAGQAEVVLLAVKPDVVLRVLAEIASVLSRERLVISVAAGVELETLEAVVPQGTPVVRAMPNIANRVRESATAISAGRWVTPAQLAVAEAIFRSVGRVVRLPEALLHAVTGLSGSGPAYALLILEALADGGVAAGLPRQVAEELAAQTLLGAARLVLETGESPAVLRAAVMSPAGTTAAGLQVLESRGVRGAIWEAVTQAARRSQELAQSARAAALRTATRTEGKA
ncbi:MAG: pyrroline-5-carboxylate reductase [Limnochordales bacterium]|nr:pyrroline-5-carboxylate reductase [Limnochordales bacterium]